MSEPSLTASRTPRWRPLLTIGLGILAPVLLVFATISTWAHFEVLAPDALGRHTRESLQQPSVRAELATQITRRVAAADPRLAAAQPVVRRAAEILISSRELADLVEIALQQVRRAVLEGEQVEGTRLVDIETQLRDTLQVIDPSIAAQIPRNWDTSVIDLSSDAALPRALRAAENIARFWWLLCVTAIAASAGWIAAAHNRRRTIGVLGASIGAVGLAVIGARRLVGAEIADDVRGQRARDATRVIFDVTTHGLRQVALAYLLAAIVIVAATLSGSWMPAVARWIGRWVGSFTRLPASPSLRVIWSVAAVVVGVALAVYSSELGPAVAAIAGVGLGFAGVSVLANTLPSRAPIRTGAPFLRARRPRLVLGSVAVFAVLATMFALNRRDVGGDDQRAEPQHELICNGHVELCDRRVDEVVFAGTHNSMSSAESGFLLAEQTSTISAQLDAGVRMLMLDTYYGIPTATGLVLTDLVFDSRAALVSRYGEETVARIEQLRSAVVQPSSAPGVYLCHSFCELGATPASAVFADVRDFLARRPSEVVVLFLQDDTEAADTVRALEASGLAGLAHMQDPDEPWPTLGELVRAGTPLLVFSQRHGGEPPWFHDAFEMVQDNPYTARSIGELSCVRNRGSRNAKLFLLNHWINRATPDVADARTVNQRDFLLDQVRRCEEAREQRVNLIAVDFWQSGGLLAAVDDLNLGENTS